MKIRVYNKRFKNRNM